MKKLTCFTAALALLVACGEDTGQTFNLVDDQEYFLLKPAAFPTQEGEITTMSIMAPGDVFRYSGEIISELDEEGNVTEYFIFVLTRQRSEAAPDAATTQLIESTRAQVAELENTAFEEMMPVGTQIMLSETGIRQFFNIVIQREEQ